MIAFEADDRTLRPWINATTTVCFEFNKRPEYQGPTSVTYNLVTDGNVDVTLQTSDLDTHQTVTVSIGGMWDCFVAFSTIDNKERLKQGCHIHISCHCD